MTSLRGPRLLLAVLSYRRGSEVAPTLPELSPGQWGAWAARMYADSIRLQAPPPGWLASPRSLIVLRRRQTSLLRKVRAYQLWQLANERVPALPCGTRPDPEAPWFPLAQRWADTYFALPGGNLPDTPGIRSELSDLRDLERVEKLIQGSSGSLFHAR